MSRVTSPRVMNSLALMTLRLVTRGATVESTSELHKSLILIRVCGRFHLYPFVRVLTIDTHHREARAEGPPGDNRKITFPFVKAIKTVNIGN